MTIRVKWSVGALALWALGLFMSIGCMAAVATMFGVFAWHFQDNWLFGLPCGIMAVLALWRVPMMLKVMWEIFCEVPGAVRERRWWGKI